MKRIFVCSFLVGMGLFLSACPKPVCGDGVVDAELGEACDDGNNIDADGCEADCSLPACENGIQDPGEICFVAKTFDTGLGSDPRAVTLGDFNGDGLLDLATALPGSAEVGVFLNLGQEQFAAPILIPLLGQAPIFLVTEDFTGDGALDLAVANRNPDEVEFLQGGGDGQFLAVQTLAVGGSPVALLTGNFDQDLSPDLVVASVLSNEVALLLNPQDGSFNFSLAQGSPLALPGSPLGLAAGDLNGSNVLDLVVGTVVQNTLSVFLGISNGQFVAPSLVSDQVTPTSVAIGDVNGDGNQDVLVTNSGIFEDVVVFLGQGDGSFVQGEPLSIEGASQNAPAFSQLKDINSDGTVDVLLAVVDSGVVVFLGQGGGQFAPPVSFPEAGFAEQVFAEDLNGDGLLDLVAPNGDANQVTVLFSAP